MIDLSSDTATRPTEAMYRAMVAAETGDEQKRADPTVNSLCERVADLLGKEAAIFLPSGVMCNNIGILTQCGRGDEVITAGSAHIANMEGGAPAAIAGVMIRPLDGERGQFTSGQIESAISKSDEKNVANTALISIEQTSNRGGGSIWPLEEIRAISQTATDSGVAMHMDGARMLNASVATGISPADYANEFDTAWVDLSKGLGCPVGAVFTGTRDLVEEAWRWKHRLGGAMRQAGVLAAAGLYALDHHVARLAEDHENAAKLAEGLANIAGIRLAAGTPDTNMIFLNIAETAFTAAELAQGLLESNISIGIESKYELRAVTHLDVSSADISTVIDAIARIVNN
jgi:threonine aldolase